MEEVLLAFGLTGEAKPFGSGHINSTFKVQSDKGIFLLQRINTNVFKDVEGLMKNIHKVTGHLQKSLVGTNQETFSIFSSRFSKLVFEDPEGGCWRCMEFKAGLLSYDIPPSADYIYQGAKSYGHFIQGLRALNPDALVETIPNFHYLSFRLQQLQAAIDSRTDTLDCELELSKVKALSAELQVLDEMRTKQIIPLRTTHNDTKFNNVLLDENGIGRCVIDLDTVMPGIVHYDFGDGARTTSTQVPEDEPDLQRVEVDPYRYQAFKEGFMEPTADWLTSYEQEYLPISGAYMSFIMSVRFLTDHINGNIYYKVNFPEQNLQRARCQLKLAEDFWKRRKDL
ncbi:MAG: aminoglycoside phosphotransferase family protein [Cyclobacteriaceae bacterium]